MIRVRLRGVDGADLAVPDGDLLLAHEGDFPLNGPLQTRVLRGAASVLLAHGETHHAVVVHGIDGVGEDAREMREVHGVRVAV